MSEEENELETRRRYWESKSKKRLLWKNTEHDAMRQPEMDTKGGRKWQARIKKQQ